MNSRALCRSTASRLRETGSSPSSVPAPAREDHPPAVRGQGVEAGGRRAVAGAGAAAVDHLEARVDDDVTAPAAVARAEVGVLEEQEDRRVEAADGLEVAAGEDHGP